MQCWIRVLGTTNRLPLVYSTRRSKATSPNCRPLHCKEGELDSIAQIKCYIGCRIFSPSDHKSRVDPGAGLKSIKAEIAAYSTQPSNRRVHSSRLSLQLDSASQVDAAFISSSTFKSTRSHKLDECNQVDSTFNSSRASQVDRVPSTRQKLEWVPNRRSLRRNRKFPESRLQAKSRLSAHLLRRD